MLFALVLVTLGTIYDGRVSTPYFTPRVMVLYPAVAALFLVWVLAVRPGARVFSLDLVDAMAAAFALWQLVAAVVAPARLLALIGEQNRGASALFWLAVMLLFVLARRLAADRRGLTSITVGVTVALVVAGLAALAQSRGLTVPWKEVDLSNGRMTGSVGNAVSLGGLSLLALWSGVIAGGDRQWGWPVRVLSGVTVAAGVVALVEAVTRAAYLGFVAGGALLAVVWLRGREWRRLVGLGIVVAVVVVATLLHGSGGLIGGGLLGSETGGESGAERGERAVSDEIRLELWAAALRATADRPVTGFGPGAFSSAYYRSIAPEFLTERPEAFATDPHDLPLLLASTSGVPGLVLGLAVLGLGTAAGLRTRRRSLGAEWGVAADASLAGAAYAAASGVFLLVSPADLVVVVPLGILLGVAAGPPAAGVFRCREVPRLPGGRLLEGGLAFLGGAALVASLLMGIQFHRADAAFAQALRGADPARAEEAATLFDYSPRFDLMAGSMVWRQAANQGDRQAAERGEALLLRAVHRDPTRAAAWIELARLYLALGRSEDAAAAVERGLEVAPHHPILEGLIGSAALAVYQESGDGDLVRSLTERLESYPPQTPDGWYWLGAVYAARGDRGQAEEAYGKAKALAPDITTEDYLARIRGIG